MKHSLIFLMLAVFVVGGRAQETQSSECVRATPERIFKKRVFPQATFALRKNKSFPFEQIGTEKLTLKNGDKLTVKNFGCENYSLSFRFETARFSRRVNDTKFWYKTAVQLIRQTIKGLRAPGLIVRGTEALNLYIKNNKKLEFEAEIDFGGSGIRDVASVSKVKRRGGKKFEVEVSFGVGPL